jgi:hypothetical protein
VSGLQRRKYGSVVSTSLPLVERRQWERLSRLREFVFLVEGSRDHFGESVGLLEVRTVVFDVLCLHLPVRGSVYRLR